MSKNIQTTYSAGKRGRLSRNWFLIFLRIGSERDAISFMNQAQGIPKQNPEYF